jgi:hypothetical protein
LQDAAAARLKSRYPDGVYGICQIIRWAQTFAGIGHNDQEQLENDSTPLVKDILLVEPQSVYGTDHV